MRSILMLSLVSMLTIFTACEKDDEVVPEIGSGGSVEEGPVLAPEEGSEEDGDYEDYTGEEEYIEEDGAYDGSGGPVFLPSDMGNSSPMMDEGFNSSFGSDNGMESSGQEDFEPSEEPVYTEEEEVEQEAEDEEIEAMEAEQVESESESTHAPVKDYPFTYEGSASGISWFSRNHKEGIFFSSPASSVTSTEISSDKSSSKPAAEEAPEIFLPVGLMKSAGVSIGDIAVIYDPSSGKQVFARIGGTDKAPEFNASVSEQLALVSEKKRSLTWLVFAKSGSESVKSSGAIKEQGLAKLQAWGDLKETDNHFKAVVL